MREYLRHPIPKTGDKTADDYNEANTRQYRMEQWDVQTWVVVTRAGRCIAQATNEEDAGLIVEALNADDEPFGA